MIALASAVWNLDPPKLLLPAGSGLVAGVFGSVLGIGGGVFLLPILVLGFHLPVHAAVASSLVAVIATSSATASVYVGEGLTNMRLGMTLETATTAGAIAGGLTAALLPEQTLLLIFAGFTVLTAGLLLRGVDDEGGAGATPRAAQGYEEIGRLAGGYVDPRSGRLVEYRARRLPIGLAVSLVASNVSGLLGVGGGFLKVPAMNLGMGVPMRVAAATSNFMIGVTAAASLVI